MLNAVPRMASRSRFYGLQIAGVSWRAHAAGTCRPTLIRKSPRALNCRRPPQARLVASSHITPPSSDVALCISLAARFTLSPCCHHKIQVSVFFSFGLGSGFIFHFHFELTFAFNLHFDKFIFAFSLMSTFTFSSSFNFDVAVSDFPSFRLFSAACRKHIHPSCLPLKIDTTAYRILVYSCNSTARCAPQK